MIEELIKNLINLDLTFIGEAPIGENNCQWIKATSGTTTVHFDKGNYDRPAYSIYFRGESNEECSNRCKQAFKRVRNYTDARSALIATRMPSFVGKDDKHRSVYVFQIEYQTGGY